MNNQIKLKDGETLTWAIYENGSGVLSLVLYAETIMEEERMGYTAKWAFGLVSLVC